MPLGEARMSRNPISEFCRLVEERELYSQPCPPTRLSSRPHASPGWQQLRLQGLGLGGVQSDLPWGVSPQESSADGRRGHRHTVSRPGSRLQLTLCCHQTSASLQQGGKNMNTAWTTTPPSSLLVVCALTHVTALATAIVGQACTGSVVATNHASVMVDDSVQVVARQLLLFLADTELAQVQVPAVPVREG